MRLFKYVTAETATAILENAKLRWAAPRTFNDPFDVQFDLHVEIDQTRTVDLILEELWQIYSRQKPLQPANTLGKVFYLFLATVSGLTREQLFAREGLKDAIRESLAKTIQLLPELHKTQRILLADAKLLCLSEVYDNILMWSHYSRNHTGAVLEFQWRDDAPTAFSQAREVKYSKPMPRLMTAEQVVAFFSGQAALDANEIMHSSIFTKAEDWSYEKEWRIWLPGTKASEDFMDIKFNSTELVAVYLGCRIADEMRKSLTALAEKNFAGIEIFQAFKSEREFALSFLRAN